LFINFPGEMPWGKEELDKLIAPIEFASKIDEVKHSKFGSLIT